MYAQDRGGDRRGRRKEEEATEIVPLGFSSSSFFFSFDLFFDVQPSEMKDPTLNM